VALNVLNVGRLEIGPLAVGGAREILSASIAYTRGRRAFGRAIAEYGAIQRKLADCAIGIYMTESATWRVVGLIQSYAAPATQSNDLAGFEEFAAECAIIKVWGSEMLDFVADEGVQMHGGYGYHRDYLVERAYRDARINRIFEGTNEINRLVIPPLLLKRAARNGVPLLETAARRLQEIALPDARGVGASNPADLVANAKTVALLLLSAAHARYGRDLKDPQEVVMGIADAIIETFVLESGVLRSEKLAAAGRAGLTGDMCAVHTRTVMGRLRETANEVLPAILSGPELDRTLEAIRALTMSAPLDVIAVRRRIAMSL
jgi:hypothetical protein